MKCNSSIYAENKEAMYLCVSCRRGPSTLFSKVWKKDTFLSRPSFRSRVFFKNRKNLLDI